MALDIEERPVHSLSSDGCKFFLKNFIRREEERPKISHDDFAGGDDVPVISLKGILEGKIRDQKEYENLCQEMVNAGAHWGFFKLIDHGVSKEIMEKVKVQVTGIFELPMEDKMKVAKSAADGSPLGRMSPYGYSSTVPDLGTNLPWVENILLKQSPEDVVAFAVKMYGDQHHHALSSALIEYMQELDKLGMAILEILAHGLGLPDDFFTRNFEDKTETTIRFNSYPPCPVPEKCLGLGHHADVQTITILLQDDVGGLQVLTSDNRWIGVQPIPDSLVVNIGDTLEAWTNGKLRSVGHRAVVNKEKSRLSVAYFLSPSKTVTIESPPQLVEPQTNPRKYVPFTWRQYSKELAAGKKIVGKTALDRYRISPGN